MKRFLLFTFDDHYPIGGWSDFRSAHDTEIEALVAAADAKSDNWQIVDTTIMMVVKYNRLEG